MKEKLIDGATQLFASEGFQKNMNDAFKSVFLYSSGTQEAINKYINLIENASNLSELEKIAALANIKQNMKHIQNQYKIINIAQLNAKNGTDFSNNSTVNSEWLERFLDLAKYVCDGETQVIWGKILANEFEIPGSTPASLIRILSEITTSLANAFRTLCSLSTTIYPYEPSTDSNENFINVIFMPTTGNDSFFVSHGLNFETIKELETIGLIVYENAGLVDDSFVETKIAYQTLDGKVIVDYKKLSQYVCNGIDIGDITLTRAGNALKEIISNNETILTCDIVENYFMTKYNIPNSITSIKN